MITTRTPKKKQLTKGNVITNLAQPQDLIKSISIIITIKNNSKMESCYKFSAVPRLDLIIQKNKGTMSVSFEGAPKKDYYSVL